MNVYSELWALLRPEKSLDGGGALFGTLAGVSPLTVRISGCEVSEGLFRPGVGGRLGERRACAARRRAVHA